MSPLSVSEVFLLGQAILSLRVSPIALAHSIFGLARKGWRAVNKLGMEFFLARKWLFHKQMAIISALSKEWRETDKGDDKFGHPPTTQKCWQLEKLEQQRMDDPLCLTITVAADVSIPTLEHLSDWPVDGSDDQKISVGKTPLTWPTFCWRSRLQRWLARLLLPDLGLPLKRGALLSGIWSGPVLCFSSISKYGLSF